MKTRAELVNEALTILGGLPAGQEAEPEDYDHVNDKVPSVLDHLSRNDIAVVSTSGIGEAEFLHVAAVLAYFSRGYFGITGQEGAELLAARLQAENDLRDLNADDTLNETVEYEFF
jgi:hypothetical protein